MQAYQKNWDFLKGKFEAVQLGHAYLFSGQDDVEKKQFAKDFVKLINGNIARSDLAIEKEQFPDLLIIKSQNSDSSIKNEKDMMEIDVDQIRAVNTFLSYKAYYGNYKTVIIENADRMNTQAQNSFLKTLEEPKGKTLLILLSSKPDALLPTIFSRCQTLTFSATKKHQQSPAEQKVLQELLPILPAELATKFSYTKKANLEGENLTNILKVLQRYFRNMLLAKITGEANNPNYSLEKIKNIIHLIDNLYLQTSTTNASPKLALEILLLEL